MKRRFGGLFVSSLFLDSLVGLPDLQPDPMDEVGFKQRAESRTEEDVTVAVVVLTAEEAKAAFDCKLYKKKIQPVWLEITNGTEDEMLFMPRSIDPQLFRPSRGGAEDLVDLVQERRTRRKKWFYYEHQMPLVIPPGETVSGFVFTNRSRGVRWVLVEAVFGARDSVHIEFIHEVPGFRADFHKLEGVISTRRSTPARRSSISPSRTTSRSGSRSSRRLLPTPTAPRPATP